ncbi:hypothetical protein Pan44_52370 [Caulifigura coniformis]|uniref:Peptidase family M50 n=1 Tax=Caulifigura coniformis TaxID=2527983 RepID=A0A517SM29_9PLAN|nr:M50 family metallopeptidase [Caulifigura coniformis]QDT57170.1 hypothetical protein Pan44_52370 [Caulifigura coniformis]
MLTLACSWLGMQWVHEAGHVLGALATGGEVERVVLHPLSISRTDLRTNPRPLVVTWAGPAFGVLAPLILWGMARGFSLDSAYLFRFFAGFCCLANGAYIGLGSFDAVGDCGELLRNGAAMGELWLFGALSSASGLILWNGQGRHFGLGNNGQPVPFRHCAGLAAITVGLISAGNLFFGTG